MKFKKGKLLILLVAVVLVTGCTKYVKTDDNKPVIYEETGQNLTSNILCKPVTEELYNLYKENESKLSTPLDSLPACEDFKPTDLEYQSLWESIFVKPLAWLILSLGKIVKNYGIAVILMSIIIRCLLIPLSRKTMLQSENIKKATPELNKIEKKYANKTDNDSLMAKSQETMLIYKKYNINPVSGCLTSFIQLPLFFGFLEAINRVPAIFEGNLWGMHLGMTPMVALSQGNYIYVFLLLLIIGSTYISFKFSMQNQSANEAMNQMKMTMTFMIVIISIASLSLPTAIALYWVVNNVFVVVQNIIVAKINGRR